MQTFDVNQNQHQQKIEDYDEEEEEEDTICARFMAMIKDKEALLFLTHKPNNGLFRVVINNFNC